MQSGSGLPPATLLAAQLISLAGGRAIIEIVLTEDLHWHPKRIDIDGCAQVSIAREGTTKPGRYGAGDRIRIVLNRVSLRASAADFRTATIDMCGNRPSITLRFEAA